MEDEAWLESRIAELRAELALPPQLIAAREAWQRAFAAYHAARGTPDEAALERRYRELLDDYNRRVLPESGRWTERLGLIVELRTREVALARLRGEPYLVRVEIDPTGLVGASEDTLVELRPALSGSGEVFVQAEMGGPAVVFKATTVHRDRRPGYAGGVVVTFWRANPLSLWGFTQARFGYPNEEAFQGNPMMGPGFEGIGFYEVVNSLWAREIVDLNRHNFPETPDDLGTRHFLLAFKENTLEVLAAGFTVEPVAPGGWWESIARYIERTDV